MLPIAHIEKNCWLLLQLNNKLRCSINRVGHYMSYQLLVIINITLMNYRSSGLGCSLNATLMLLPMHSVSALRKKSGYFHRLHKKGIQFIS